MGAEKANDTYFKNVIAINVEPNEFFSNFSTVENKSLSYHDVWDKIQSSREIAHKKFIQNIPFCDLLAYSYLVDLIPKHIQIQAANS